MHARGLSIFLYLCSSRLAHWSWCPPRFLPILRHIPTERSTESFPTVVPKLRSRGHLPSHQRTDCSKCSTCHFSKTLYNARVHQLQQSNYTRRKIKMPWDMEIPMVTSCNCKSSRFLFPECHLEITIVAFPLKLFSVVGRINLFLFTTKLKTQRTRGKLVRLDLDIFLQLQSPFMAGSGSLGFSFLIY